MHRRWNRPLAVAALLVALAPAGAAEPARDHAVTVDDYFTLAGVSEVALAPDGKLVAYAEGRWDKAADDRKTDLWVAATDGSGVKRLTADRANDRSLKWAPDGKTVYFLGNRKREGEKKPPFDGTTQVWKVSADGGDPSAVTRLEGGVEGYDLTADGKTLFYAVNSTAKDEDGFSALRDKYPLEYGHGSRKASQVWKLDLTNWRAEKLIDEGRYVHEFAATADGKRLAMITAPDDRVITFEGRSTVDVWEAATGKVARLPDKSWRADAPSPYAWLEKLAWSRDGEGLAFNAVFDAYPAEIVLTSWGGGKPESSLLQRGGRQVRGYGSPWRGSTTAGSSSSMIPGGKVCRSSTG